MEELILQGRVSIDGQVVRDLATRVDPGQSTITLDGERIKQERTVYIAVFKPKGYISTNDDPSGRPRVVDLVPGLPERVYPIGRLDEESTGLILLTNDGELANRLAHPRYGVEKVYRALIAGRPGPEVLDRLVQGVWLAEGKARARDARFVGGKQSHGEASMIELTLAEGKNREVRRMLAKLGHKVMSLSRVAVGPVTTRGLNIGEWRYLEPGEVALLRRVAWGEAIRPPSRDRRRDAAPRRPAGPGPGPRPQAPGPRVGMGHLVGSADARGGDRPGPAPRPGPRPRFGNNDGPGGPPPRGGNQARKGPVGVPRRGAVGSFAPPPGAPRSRRPIGDNGPDEILVTPFDSNSDAPPPPRPRRPAGPPPRRPGSPPPRRPGGPPTAQGGPRRGHPPMAQANGPRIVRQGGPSGGNQGGPYGNQQGGPPPRRRPKPLPKSRRIRRPEGQ